MPKIGDEGQRFVISVKRCSDNKRVDFCYFGEPADSIGQQDPNTVFVAASLKEMVRAYIVNKVYKDPEIIDRKTGESAKLKMDDA
jgi:hypothetical protein